MERIIFLAFDSWLMRMTQMCYLKIEREKYQENVNVSKILDIKNVYKWGEFEVQFKSKIFTKRLSSFGGVNVQCPGLAKIVYYKINLFHLSKIWPSGKFMTIGQDVFIWTLF